MQLPIAELLVVREFGEPIFPALEHFVRLDINQAATIKKLLLITSNPQLDELFGRISGTHTA